MSWYLSYISNQREVPAMLSNTLANIPATALKGTLFVATDTFALYRYDGSTWALIGGPGTGTITGSGTASQIAYFSASSVLTSSSAFTVSGNRMTLQELTTNTDADINGVIFGRGNLGKVFNVAAGAGALFNQSGVADGYNVAVGFNALRNSGQPQNSVAIGAFALANGNTTGVNIAIGYEALLTNTTATQNIGIGYQALYGNSSGNSNTGIGHNVMYQATTGINNVAVGARALYNSNTGSNNVAIGYEAGNQTGTGVDNFDPIQCVYIGGISKAGNGAGGYTNEIVIGYNATGNGSNTVTIGNNNIVNTYLKGTVNGNTFTVGNGETDNQTLFNYPGGLKTIYRTNATAPENFGFNIDLSAQNSFFTYTEEGGYFQCYYKGDSQASSNIWGVSTKSPTDSTYIAAAVLTQNRLFGVGLNNPAGMVHAQAEGTFGQVYFDGYGTTGANIILRNSRGTILSPSQVLTNDLLGSIGVRGYTDTGFVGGGKAGVYMYAAENFTATAQGTYMRLETTPIGGASRVSRILINDNGNILVNTVVDNLTDKLQVDGSILTTSYIKTGNPTGGTAQPWKLGSYVAGAPAATGYAEIEINGTAYKLLTST